MDDKNKQYPEGHFVGRWMAIGMVIFSGVGVAISTATDNPGLMGIGPAIGIGVGIAIGASIEAKKKSEGLIRPLNDIEKKRRKSVTKWGIVLLGIGMVVLILGIILFKSK